KLTVVLRKAYGAGYFVMCGRAYEPDLIVAWPTAEISVMGPEGGTNIIFRKEISNAANSDVERARRVDEFRKLIDPYHAARAALTEDGSPPGGTRRSCPGARERAPTKRAGPRRKKRGVRPFKSGGPKKPPPPKPPGGPGHPGPASTTVGAISGPPT